MEVINTKDKKILHQLLTNSRQSLTSIGKKVGISKELALYRIKRLQDKKIIINNTIYVDTSKLGYTILNFYYNYSNINPSVKKEIVDYFVKSEFTNYVGSTEGIYDLQVDFFVGDPIEFESFYDKTQVKYRKFFSNHNGSGPIRAEIYPYPFLVNDKTNVLKPIQLSWGAPLIKIDTLDFNILKELSSNSRTSTKDIANNLNSTITIINNRINKLIKNKVIISFTANIDWSKLGYRLFSIELIFSDYSKKNKIIQYLRKNPHLIYIIKPLAFNSDLECIFCLQHNEQLRKIIEKMTHTFPTDIRSCNFFSTYQIHKNKNLPPKVLPIPDPFYKVHDV
jgi:DNA-binding Lrp family transcriptional regulator